MTRTNSKSHQSTRILPVVLPTKDMMNERGWLKYIIFYCVLITGGIFIYTTQSTIHVDFLNSDESLQKGGEFQEDTIKKSLIGPYKYLIEEENFCSRRPRMKIIAYVHSSISRVKNRNDTRHTWAHVTSYRHDINIGVVFVVGRGKDDVEQQVIDSESHLYQDIIQTTSILSIESDG
ncbi:hypothetical protein SK128_009087 [Halocaridina rubra]|uniref:Hexosyltransferase n=1 Tax=Halocaridina rubra TaxID=373956 RepID=A0AAN9A150_HALRR